MSTVLTQKARDFLNRFDKKEIMFGNLLQEIFKLADEIDDIVGDREKAIDIIIRQKERHFDHLLPCVAQELKLSIVELAAVAKVVDAQIKNGDVVRMSQGEKQIRDFLDKHNIQYKQEFVFKELDKKRFDFYLPKNKTVIEFDGKQHFEAVEYFGGTENFRKQQERDKQKDEFCTRNNIKVLRIPYTEQNNINKILSDFLGVKRGV
jgi:hypothetical group I intron protein